MNSIFLLLISTYLVIITFGSLFSKYLKLPWMFTVVIYGILLSIFGVFQDVFQTEQFKLLSQLGMLFFLFTIGLELNLREIKRLGKVIVLGNLALVLTEATLLALVFYFFFPSYVSNNFFVAFIAGMAFGTVGEVLLMAVLKEFGIENTRFGQLALGIGVFDDIFEIFAMGVIVALPAFVIVGGDNSTAVSDGLQIFGILIGLVIVSAILIKFGKQLQVQFQRLGKLNDKVPPFLIFLVFFSFIYLTSTKFESLGIVAAIFAGLVIKEVLPTPWVEQYKKPIFFAANFILGPFFFLKLGSGISFQALLSNPLLIIIIMAISLSSRMMVSYLVFRKIVGNKESIVLGVGLCAKMSTSVVSENLLFSSGMIAAPLYSAIMVTFILLKPIVIAIFSRNLALIQDDILLTEQRDVSSKLEVLPQVILTKNQPT